MRGMRSWQATQSSASSALPGSSWATARRQALPALGARFMGSHDFKC